MIICYRLTYQKPRRSTILAAHHAILNIPSNFEFSMYEYNAIEVTGATDSTFDGRCTAQNRRHGTDLHFKCNQAEQYTQYGL